MDIDMEFKLGRVTDIRIAERNNMKSGTHPLKMGFPSRVVTEAGRP